MGKINKEEEARRSGMAYAFKIASEKGIDELKKELQFRNITKAPLMIPKSEVKRYSEEVKRNCVTTFKLATLLSLADGFNWKKEQLEAFWDVFMDKIDTLLATDRDGECFASWSDYAAILWDEFLIKVDLPESFIEMEKKN